MPPNYLEKVRITKAVCLWGLSKAIVLQKVRSTELRIIEVWGLLGELQGALKVCSNW